MMQDLKPSFSLQDFTRLLLQNRKQAGMYALVFIVISFNICLFLPGNLHNPAAERIWRAVQLGCFAAMGVVNIWLLDRRNILSAFSLPGAKLVFISLLFFVIGLVLFIYYLVSGSSNGLTMAFASSGSFLLPFLIYQDWLAFNNIPAKKYAAFYLPVSTSTTNALSTLPSSNSMQVQLQIARSLSDENENTFPVITSGKLKLGKLLEQFVEHQQGRENILIETTDEEKQPVGWEFFQVSWLGLYTRHLNPTMTLLENRVRPNSKIKVTRVREERKELQAQSYKY